MLDEPDMNVLPENWQEFAEEAGRLLAGEPLIVKPEFALCLCRALALVVGGLQDLVSAIAPVQQVAWSAITNFDMLGIVGAYQEHTNTIDETMGNARDALERIREMGNGQREATD